MRSKGKHNRQPYITSAILIAVICVGLMLVNFLYAKYVKELSFSGNVTISANLAEGFALYEHKVTQNNDGSYVMGDVIVDKNEYHVLPGINIPKDPTVSITKKSDVPAYLFVEVVDKVDHDVIKFNIASHWKKVEGAVPRHGGVVYVFTVDGAAAKLTDETNADLINSIGIIAGNELTVSRITKDNNGNDIDFYSRAGTATVDLDFYAYLVQINTGESVADVFNKLAPAETEAPSETTAITENP